MSRISNSNHSIINQLTLKNILLSLPVKIMINIARIILFAALFNTVVYLNKLRIIDLILTFIKKHNSLIFRLN